MKCHCKNPACQHTSTSSTCPNPAQPNQHMCADCEATANRRMGEPDEDFSGRTTHYLEARLEGMTALKSKNEPMRKAITAELERRKLTPNPTNPLGIDQQTANLIDAIKIVDKAAAAATKEPMAIWEKVNNVRKRLNTQLEEVLKADDGLESRASVVAGSGSLPQSTHDVDAARVEILKCDACDKEFESDEDLTNIDDLFQRVRAGDTMPAGQCPDCEGLVFPVSPDAPKVAPQRTNRVTVGEDFEQDKDGNPTNDQRAQWAATTIQLFDSLVGGEWINGRDRESTLSDLLADLMHLCDRTAVNFGSALSRAVRAHAEESNATVKESALAAAEASLTPYVLITVSGGVASVVENTARIGVDILDYDNIHAALRTNAAIVLSEREEAFLREHDNDDPTDIYPRYMAQKPAAMAFLKNEEEEHPNTDEHRAGCPPCQLRFDALINDPQF